MGSPRSLHAPEGPTPGVLCHGRRDLLAAIFFGGRRRRVFRRLAALSGAGPGDGVLDVGCGTGYFPRVMAEAVGQGGTALGVDPPKEAVAAVRRRTRLVHCGFSEGTAEALEAPDGAYDVAVRA